MRNVNVNMKIKEYDENNWKESEKREIGKKR